MIFVGYSEKSKAFKFLDRQNQRIHLNGSAIFDNEMFHYTKDDELLDLPLVLATDYIIKPTTPPSTTPASTMPPNVKYNSPNTPMQLPVTPTKQSTPSPLHFYTPTDNWNTDDEEEIVQLESPTPRSTDIYMKNEPLLRSVILMLVPLTPPDAPIKFVRAPI
jgi:hypothetical protein